MEMHFRAWTTLVDVPTQGRAATRPLMMLALYDKHYDVEVGLALHVQDGCVHVYHMASGCRVSTTQGFTTLAGALEFAHRIRDMVPWREAHVTIGHQTAPAIQDAWRAAREFELSAA